MLCQFPPVFVGTAAGRYERQVDQLDGNPPIAVGLDGVGQLKELARSFVGIGEGAISREFVGHSALSLRDTDPHVFAPVTAPRDRPDANIAMIDMPAIGAFTISAAREGGHAAVKRNRGG